MLAWGACVVWGGGGGGGGGGMGGWGAPGLEVDRAGGTSAGEPWEGWRRGAVVQEEDWDRLEHRGLFSSVMS